MKQDVPDAKGEGKRVDFSVGVIEVLADVINDLEGGDSVNLGLWTCRRRSEHGYLDS